MQRREFIRLLGGMAAWPLTARAEQSERMRRVAVLVGVGAGDLEYQRRIAGLRQALREMNWVEGRNIVFDLQFGDGKPERLAALAATLIEAKPDVIVTSGSGPTDAVRKQTRTLPIVMVSVGDAVGSGFISSLAHPGGNITGQTHVATEQSAKRLELLKEIAPAVTRIAVISNGDNPSHHLQFKEMERAAPILGIGLVAVPVRNASELDPGLQVALKTGINAIITMDDSLVASLRRRIVDLSTHNKLPVMGEFRLTAEAGGLVSYGPDQVALFRLIAGHIDKILKGANPGDLPVQQPTKFELIINLKTAKALGLNVPPGLLNAADEIIE